MRELEILDEYYCNLSFRALKQGPNNTGNYEKISIY